MAVVAAHPVAATPLGAGQGVGADHAVVKADGDLVLLVAAHILFHLVAGEGTAHGASDGGQVLAAATAYLVTENAAEISACEAMKVAPKVPIRMPGVIRRTTSQRTAP